MKELRSTNEFDAYTRIHTQLSSEISCLSRRRLFHDKFKSTFAKAISDVLGPGYCTPENEIDCKHIMEMENVTKDCKQLADFNSKLCCFDVERTRLDRKSIRVDFWDALEMVLLDLDIIAGPLYRQNRAVEEAVRIYEPIIRGTAPAVRPFVAM